MSYKHGSYLLWEIVMRFFMSKDNILVRKVKKDVEGKLKDMGVNVKNMGVDDVSSKLLSGVFRMAVSGLDMDDKLLLQQILTDRLSMAKLIGSPVADGKILLSKQRGGKEDIIKNLSIDEQLETVNELISQDFSIDAKKLSPEEEAQLNIKDQIAKARKASQEGDLVGRQGESSPPSRVGAPLKKPTSQAPHIVEKYVKDFQSIKDDNAERAEEKADLYNKIRKCLGAKGEIPVKVADTIRGDPDLNNLLPSDDERRDQSLVGDNGGPDSRL